MSKKPIIPIPIYENEPTSDLIKGVAIRVLFTALGNGLSARIMGKGFMHYAIYGGVLAMGTNLAIVLYTKQKLKMRK